MKLFLVVFSIVLFSCDNVKKKEIITVKYESDRSVIQTVYVNKGIYNLDTILIESDTNALYYFTQLDHNLLKEIINKDSIPVFYKLFQEQFSPEFVNLANPNENFDATDAISGIRPRQKLLYLAKNNNTIILAKVVGGLSLFYGIECFYLKNNIVFDYYKATAYEIKGKIDLSTREGVLQHLSRYYEAKINYKKKFL
jgi:hypothetical protein